MRGQEDASIHCVDRGRTASEMLVSNYNTTRRLDLRHKLCLETKFTRKYLEFRGMNVSTKFRILYKDIGSYFTVSHPHSSFQGLIPRLQCGWNTKMTTKTSIQI